VSGVTQCYVLTMYVCVQVEASLSVDVKRQLLRAQYTSAISLRVAFFLQQGVRQSQLSGKSSVDGAAGGERSYVRGCLWARVQRIFDACTATWPVLACV
jgi:hypothetical protein